MDSIPNLQRVIGKIRTIEMKLDSFNHEFNTLHYQSPTFRDSLNNVRESLREKSNTKLPENNAPMQPELFENDEGFETMDDSEFPDTMAMMFSSINKTRDLENSGNLNGTKNLEKLRELLVKRSDLPSSSKLASRLVDLHSSDPAMPDSMSILFDNVKDRNYPGSRLPGKGNGIDWLTAIVDKQPSKIVKFENYTMQAKTASKFRELKDLLKKEFPGRSVYVTSTMGGRHTPPAHPDGRAIDFVVDRLTTDESKKVEKLAKDCGFYVYNEYINSSRYKTGDHMHVEI